MAHHQTSGEFVSRDGSALFFRAWAPPEPSDKAVILLHRGHEHSGRLAGLFEELDLDDFWGFAWDQRGHGHSPGERGYAESYAKMVRDLDDFVHFVSEKHSIPINNMVVVANSVGAVTAATWVHDYAPAIRAVVMAAPAFRIKLYVPFAIPLLRLFARIKRKASIKSYVKSRLLTHDPIEAKAYDDDPLITREIAVNILLELHDTARRIVADAGAIHTPTLVLSAGSDWVVDNRPQRSFFNSLSSQLKELYVLPGFYHGVFYEKERRQAIEHARRFIEKAFHETPSTDRLIDADKRGYTRQEYERLLAPAPPLSAIGYAFQRLATRTVGRLSEGIRLGWRSGFDSGEMLDYVYENRARGWTPVGRVIDRIYLDTIGWRGIRRRGKNLESCLARTIDIVAEKKCQPRILDIAAGAGRYVLNVVAAKRALGISVQLRDNTEANLDVARGIAGSFGLESVDIRLGDAFDSASIASAAPAPNIVIVSGLYELFPDNGQVGRSLAAIADVIEPGGFLIYTSQPWHPQVELIARTLINRDGKPWIMRRRTQAEMDALVRHVGFEKTTMEVGPYGIFSVAVAQKQGGPDV